MTANTFGRMAVQGGYRQVGVSFEPNGHVYVAEKITLNENGEREYQTMWAAGRDDESLEIAQKVYFKWGTPRHDREQHAIECGRVYLSQRDYGGDSRRL